MTNNKVTAIIFTTALTAVVTKLVASYFPTVLTYAQTTFSTIASWFTSVYPIKGYNLLLALLIIPSISLLANCLKREQELPFPYNYTNDTIEGILWRWEYRNNGIKNLHGYCPYCDGDIVSKHNQSSYDGSIVLYCEHCSTPYKDLPLPPYATHTSEATKPYRAKIEREVLRRIRVKEKELTNN